MTRIHKQGVLLTIGVISWLQSVNGATQSSRFVYHTDGLGSVVAMTDSSQLTAKSYSYEAFGKIRSETGTLTIDRYTYTAREALGDSLGLHYYRWRVMDPNVGRSTSEDPLGFVDEASLYPYVLNDPVNLIDQEGLQSQKCCTFGSCFSRCMRANGAGWALGALGLAAPFASVPYPGNKQLLGSGNPWTSVFSMAVRSFGGRALALAARRVNPYANAVAVGAGGFLAGLSISRSSMCAADCNSW